MEAQQTPVDSSVSSPAPVAVKLQSRQSSMPASAPAPSVPENVGAPTRQWINAEVTPVLLEGMRWLARERYEEQLTINYMILTIL